MVKVCCLCHETTELFDRPITVSRVPDNRCFLYLFEQPGLALRETQVSFVTVLDVGDFDLSLPFASHWPLCSNVIQNDGYSQTLPIATIQRGLRLQKKRDIHKWKT